MNTFWYDGKLIASRTIELDIDNPGLLYGATIFTTLRVYENSLDNRLTHWQSHLERLKKSLNYFDWLEPDWEMIRQGAEAIKQHFPVLRITVFPDGKEWIIGRMLPQDLAHKQKHGITASLSNPRLYRSLPNQKTGNYLTAWFAKTQALQINSQEAIFVDDSGNWLETSTGNLWGWKDDQWWIPPTNAGILPGIVQLNLKTYHQVREEVWTIELASSFEAMVYSNSVVEIIPIHTVIYPNGKLEYNIKHHCIEQLRRYWE